MILGIPLLHDATPRWGRHEFGADGIGDCLKYPIHFGFRGGVKRPTGNLIDWIKLIGTTRPPERCADPLIQHPPNRQLDHLLAEALLRELIELFDR